jgi:hypothetical protein
MAETRGQRFFLVRLACGDGIRRPEPMREFVQRVARAAGLVIHPSVLSEIENDKATKTVTLDQIAAVASVDPLRRGKLWLAWGEAEDSARRALSPASKRLEAEPEPVAKPAAKRGKGRKNANGPA